MSYNAVTVQLLCIQYVQFVAHSTKWLQVITSNHSSTENGLRDFIGLPLHNFAHCTMSPIRPASNCRLSSKAMVQFNERVIRTRDPVTFVVHDSKRISHLFSHLTMSAPGQPSCGQEKWYSAAQNTRVSSDTIQWFICWVQFQVHRNWMHRRPRRLQWNMSINTPTRISWRTWHVLHLKCGHKHRLIIMEEIMFMFLTQIQFFSGWSERMLLP